MITTYYVSPDFEARAREAKPDDDIRVDNRLVGDNWYAMTGILPNKGLPPLPPGWKDDETKVGAHHQNCDARDKKHLGACVDGFGNKIPRVKRGE